MPKSTEENATRFGLPAAGWTLFGAVARPKSRCHLRLTGPNPLDPIQIEANTLSEPEDLKAAIACVELCREIGNSAVLGPFVKREVMPGNLRGAKLENFVPDAATSFWHETCTAKMGQDAMSVVDGNLKVYGIEARPATRLSKIATWSSLVTHLETESAEGSDETMTTSQAKNPELLERSTE